MGKLNELMDGDQAFADELVAAFCSSAAQSLDEIAHHVAADQRAQVARAAHRLKGAAANIHAEVVAELAATLESGAGELTRHALDNQAAVLRLQTVRAMEFLRAARHDGFRSSAA
jgi:HPt (histidine-containing phosphotransfer) domain-containing protein